jgi:hypothetical protein
MSNIDFYASKQRTVRSHPSGHHETLGSRMGHKVLLRNKQRLLQESANERINTSMVTTPKGRSASRLQTATVVNNSNQEKFPIKDKYSRAGKNFNEDSCGNQSQYVRHEYEGKEIQTQDDMENEDSYDEEDEEGVMAGDVCYNY